MTSEQAIAKLREIRSDYWVDDGYGNMTDDCADGIVAIDQAIEALQERKTGKWVKDKYGTDHCSCCDYIPAYDTTIDDIYYSPYYPNCGAKLEVDE